MGVLNPDTGVVTEHRIPDKAQATPGALPGTHRVWIDNEGLAADVANAYNEFWWDYGKKLTRDKRTSLIVDPPDGRIPRTEAAEERAAARREARRNRGPAAGPEDRGLWEHCITRSVPRLSGAYNNNFQLFQSADHVVILNEMIHEARIVPLDGRPHTVGGA